MKTVMMRICNPSYYTYNLNIIFKISTIILFKLKRINRFLLEVHFRWKDKNNKFKLAKSILVIIYVSLLVKSFDQITLVSFSFVMALILFLSGYFLRVLDKNTYHLLEAIIFCHICSDLTNYPVFLCLTFHFQTLNEIIEQCYISFYVTYINIV